MPLKIHSVGFCEIPDDLEGPTVILTGSMDDVKAVAPLWGEDVAVMPDGVAAGPYGYLICDPALDESSCVLSDDPMSDEEQRDGCRQFPLFMKPEDAFAFHALWRDKGKAREPGK